MGMEQTLYADVLFFINFSMDFLSLYLTVTVLRRPLRVRALLLAAAIGGVYGVAACFLSGPPLFAVILHVAVSVLMCFLAFRERILFPCALFYGIGCLLGGVMTALYSHLFGLSGARTVFVDGSYYVLPGEIPLGWMAVAAGIIGVAAIAGGRSLKRSQTARDCRLVIRTEAGEFVCQGLYDSGNLLCDPFSGRAVIVLAREAFLRILPEELRPFAESGELLPPDPLAIPSAKRLRLLPSSSVGGRALLLGYLPQSVSVDGIGKEAVLGMGGETFDGREALVPAVFSETVGRKRAVRKERKGK